MPGQGSGPKAVPLAEVDVASRLPSCLPRLPDLLSDLQQRYVRSQRRHADRKDDAARRTIALASEDGSRLARCRGTGAGPEG